MRTLFAILIPALIFSVSGCSTNKPDVETLYDAINCGRANEVRAIISANPNIVNLDTAIEYGILTTAISDCPEVVGLLLEQGADPNLIDSVGDAPLKVAIQNGQVDCVKTLLQHGAKVDHGRDEPTYIDLTLQEIYYEDDHSRPLAKIYELLIEHGARKTSAKDLGLCPNGSRLVDVPVVGEFDIEDDELQQIERGERIIVEDEIYLETHPYSPESKWHFSPMARQWDKTAPSVADFQRTFPDVIANFDAPDNSSVSYGQVLKRKQLVESYLELQVRGLNYDELVEHGRKVLRGQSVTLPESFADDGHAILQLNEKLELQIDAHSNDVEGEPMFRLKVSVSTDEY